MKFVCEIETFQNAAREGTSSIILVYFLDEQDIIVQNIAKIEHT